MICYHCGHVVDTTVWPPKGWAVRADRKISCCPHHRKIMPPHEEGRISYLNADIEIMSYADWINKHRPLDTWVSMGHGKTCFCVNSAT